MYVSMTGFGRVQEEMDFGSVTLELSSVNHRYQEIYVRLPKEFSSWEPWFHQKLKRFFRRGKVQVRMDVLWVSGMRRAKLNRDVLDHYYQELEAAWVALGQSTSIGIESLLSLPGVFDTPSFTEESGNMESREQQLTLLLEKGVLSWQKMREQEGLHLKEEVLLHLGLLTNLADKISRLWSPARDLAFAAMKKRMEDSVASFGEQLDQGRLLQELALLTDRWDITEELARLRSHIAKFISTGEEKDSSGRKLDFIVQEMNREVNTLDSKVADAEIRWLAVEAKATLERIREQIQNVE
ncbi:MAG: YicC family protein [Synergistaceae bacterium]|nr:YicC family protein [Synergistaceae bacterium]MBP9626836.1 YicC family protein [Synergistaceae bacterium]MBP9957915.1 YicC family protein [Synergistaceae bacterium]